MTPRPASLTDRRRLAKAGEILADPRSTWRQQLVDLLDTAIALDPPDGWEPEPDGEIDHARNAAFTLDRVLVAMRELPASALDHYIEPAPSPPRGLSRAWPKTVPT